MVLAIVVTLIVTAALGYGFRRERGGALIVTPPIQQPLQRRDSRPRG